MLAFTHTILGFIQVINDLLSDVDDVLQNTIAVHSTFTQGAYADDYFGVTGNAGDCQIMADACRSHSLKWRRVPNLGVDKTAIVVFKPMNAPVMWGNKVITIQNTYRLESPSVAQANGMPTLQSYLSALEEE